MKLAVVLALVSGCKAILGIEGASVTDGSIAGDDAPNIEDAPDALIDGPPIDARTCFGTFQQICLQATPPDTFQATGATSISTCTETQTVGGVAICIQAAKHIVIDAGATLSTNVAPFVVLVATEDIVVSGTIDGWNAGSTTCTMGGTPGVAAGGPGGSFGALGGAGGANSLVQPGPIAGPISTFRRGCAGGDGGSDSLAGNGGPGGAGIFLVAPSIRFTNTGRINASGSGGTGGINDRGGGGGGSGGFIVLDSETLVIESGALVVALGGGGGGGGGGAGQAQPGTRATLTGVPGLGGDGSAAASGDGGDGGITGSGMAGEPGSNGRGGGGGGGSVGVIFMTAPFPSVSGSVLPTPTAPS